MENISVGFYSRKSSNVTNQWTQRRWKNFINSLIGRCPNLRNLEAELMTNITIKIFDALFASCPKLEILHLMNAIVDEELLNSRHFWRLVRLKVLKNCRIEVGDLGLIKIIDCFPN